MGYTLNYTSLIGLIQNKIDSVQKINMFNELKMECFTREKTYF